MSQVSILTPTLLSDIDTSGVNYFSSLSLAQKLKYFIQSTPICLNPIQNSPHSYHMQKNKLLYAPHHQFSQSNRNFIAKLVVVVILEVKQLFFSWTSSWKFWITFTSKFRIFFNGVWWQWGYNMSPCLLSFKWYFSYFYS